MSNLVISDNRAMAYFSDDQLAQKTLTLIRHSNNELSTEAAFVITNMLTSVSNSTLIEIWSKKGSEIVEAICSYFKKFHQFHND